MTIAFWCVLVAILLPYVWFQFVQTYSEKQKRDNEQPRDFLKNLTGKSLAAYGAHTNSFETNPGFIAGVIIAHLTHAPQGRIDLLALAYIGFRILYGIFYITEKGMLRSLAWMAGMVTMISLFAASSW